MTPNRLNPWLTMIYRPKATMRYILDHYPKKWIHTLAIAGAFTHVATSANFYIETWWTTLIFWFILSVLTGLIALYIFGGLLKWSGKWLKGKSKFQNILAAIAWAQIPGFYFFIVEQGLLLAMGGVSSNVFYATLRFVFAIWSFVIFLCCLQEAQEFTFFRSVINYVIAIVIFAVGFLIINLMINFFGQPSPGGAIETTGQNASTQR